jgi:hypothetical protein
MANVAKQTSKIGSLVDVEDSKDAEVDFCVSVGEGIHQLIILDQGLKIFYFLVQDLRCFVFSLIGMLMQQFSPSYYYTNVQVFTSRLSQSKVTLHSETILHRVHLVCRIVSRLPNRLLHFLRTCMNCQTLSFLFVNVVVPWLG